MYRIHASLQHCTAVQYAPCRAWYGCRPDSYYTAQCASVCVCVSLWTVGPRGNSESMQSKNISSDRPPSLTESTTTCPVASTTWLLASLILFKGLKPPSGPQSDPHKLTTCFHLSSLKTFLTCKQQLLVVQSGEKLFLCLCPFTLCSQQDFTSELFHMEVWFVPLWGDESPAQTGSSYEKGGNGAP